MTPGLWSVLIQAIGSAATLGAAAFVAWRFGLAAQGEFGLLRSWSDALTALAALGLPQGLLHLQYREGVPAAALWRFVRRYAAALALVCLPVVATLALTATFELAATHRAEASVIVAAVPFAVAHLLWRSLVLKTRGVVRYSIVTGLPSVLVLAGVVALGAAGVDAGFEWILLGTAILAASAAAVWSSAAFAPAPAPPPWPRHVLWSVSLQTWLQAALSALLVAAILTLSRALGAGLGEIGLLSLGLYVYQFFGALAAYAAPVVYDRVAGAPVTAAGLASMRSWRKGAWRVAAASFVLALLAPQLVALAWPAASEYAITMTFFAIAGLAALGSRLGATLLQALGQMRELSAQAVWRLAVALVLTGALMRVMTASSAVPVALLSVELLTVARLVWLLRAVAADAPGIEKGAT